MNDQQGKPPAPEVRELDSIVEMRETEAIQREVWGLPDVDVVPAAQLRAAVHAGGQLAGAFEAGTMVGFAYGLVATPHGRGMTGVGLHSHMVAVREQGRQRGVGRALKWFQRRWSLKRGMNWITWTFDPLQARNAKLNFEHLGVVSHDYLVDFYGAMAGPLGSSASDRLVALWLLDSEPVRRRAAADATGELAEPGRSGGNDRLGDRRELWLLRSEDLEETAETASDGGATVAAVVEDRSAAFRTVLADAEPRRVLRVAVPGDVGQLRLDRPELVDEWRRAMRAAMIPALAAGYRVAGFVEGAYLLELSNE